MTTDRIRETSFNFGALKRGKVRDIYTLNKDHLLMITTDRISVHDIVLEDIIPTKGIILTKMTLFWLELLKGIVPNHLITGNFEEFPTEIQHGAIKGRAMIVRNLNPIPFEFIVRGYLSGSAWDSYKDRGTVCGIELPASLKESDKLPKILFTPSTKAEGGTHDVNISFDDVVDWMKKNLGRKKGMEVAFKIRSLSIALYMKASEYALSRGIIIADTKLEYGLDSDGILYLIDEVLTPDSSRFWPKDKYAPGKPQESLDKQYVRNFLSGWDKKPPIPKLPPAVISNTREKYIEILKILTASRV